VRARFALVALALLVASAPPAAEEAAPEFVRIDGTRVSLPRPEGFVKGQDFAGLSSLDRRVRIEVTEFSRPFSEAAEAYDKEKLHEKGLMLLKRIDRPVAGHDGLLALMAARVESGEVAIWLSAFGDEDGNVVVRAIAPKTMAPSIHETMIATVLGPRWDRDAELDEFAGLPFTLPVLPALLFGQRLGTQLVYTKDGVVPLDSPFDPLLSVIYRKQRVPPEKRQEFCRSVIEDSAEFEQVSWRVEPRPIEVEGLSGCEALARARSLRAEGLVEEGEKVWVSVYQAALFEFDGYYAFTGFVHLRHESPWVRRFARVAHGMKRR
jgi:hypothetical protein